jgi:hypothetical protein
MLSTVALAAPESYQIGEYVVSFDLNTDAAHQIQAVDPVQGQDATAYPLLIVTDNNTGASITITENNMLQDSSMKLNREVAALRLILYKGINVTESNEMTIDGADGFVLSGLPIPGSNLPQIPYYYASFWLDSNGCGDCESLSAATTNVGITSTYSSEITQSLLNSIHIEKGQAAPAAQASAQQQVLPPA